MRLGGVDIISRATRSSMRVLLSLGVAILLVHYLEIDISEVTVLGIRLELNQTEGVIKSVLFIVLVSHVVQWFGDFLSLRNWNVALKSTEVQILFGGRTTLVSKLEMYLKDWENLKSIADEGKADVFEKQIELLSSETRKLRRFVLGDTIYAWFYVVLWSLVLPLGIGIWAWKAV
ncbi:hypothetical protein [uncultured Ruegeria sp.]|uniref:hypothetical protein n=1 Tax=uncultured Ruegeria sp. TaxID=259304 RepID=UPI00261C9CB6|nr:hypothetical protein [uncultured Ruegeria sp.]